MPEILEIEMYRRGALATIGRTIVEVVAPDNWYLKRIDAPSLSEALTGAQIEGVSRVGKLLLLETSSTLCGLRFGMTGRLVIDDVPAISRLEYSSATLNPAWDRFGLVLSDGGSLKINDPRRLGGVMLDPDPAALGPDAWGVTSEQLGAILANRKIQIKALLLDQTKIAGLGNLLADELLWRSAVSPKRPAGNVSDAKVAAIAAELPTMLDELFRRGGSHCGDLFSERHIDGRCPVDGSSLMRDAIGGRSTWWCPEHQL